jgi:TPP-dependent pyruvate/acetoin dehydrogenase alpha subunit
LTPALAGLHYQKLFAGGCRMPPRKDPKSGAPVDRSDNELLPSDLLKLYGDMTLIRHAEQRLAELFADGEIPGFIHLSIGQEAVPVGIAAALQPGDTLASNHRGHGHAIAKGMDLARFFMEVMGRREGYCGGRGGSMHVADMSVGMLGANGIVGAGLSIAVGSALGHKVRKTGYIASVFFGDGALAEGVLHESFNLAALWKLPILFVCENNGWSEFSPASRQIVTDALRIASSFAIPCESVDGNDVVAVRMAALTAVAAIRNGAGPFLIECKTTRMRGHFEGDAQKYRDAAEIAEVERADPIRRFETYLRQRGMADSETAAAAAAEATRRVSEAVAMARAGTLPQPSEVLAGVYAVSSKASP